MLGELIAQVRNDSRIEALAVSGKFLVGARPKNVHIWQSAQPVDIHLDQSQQRQRPVGMVLRDRDQQVVVDVLAQAAEESNDGFGQARDVVWNRSRRIERLGKDLEIDAVPRQMS